MQPPHAPLPGFNEQACLDTNCQEIVLSPATPAVNDLTNHDHHDPPVLYNMDLVLQLLQTALANDDTGFWATLLHEHHIGVPISTPAVHRSAFIEHLYSGECVKQEGVACSTVVKYEQSPLSMALRMNDVTIQWLNQNLLSSHEYVSVCLALNISSPATNKMRSLLSKWSECRRCLLATIDAAALKFTDLLLKLGCSSSLKSLTPIADAHGVAVAEYDTKEDAAQKILHHVSQGRCARDKSTPGCGGIVKELAAVNDVALIQVAVLWQIHELASKKQLTKVLEIHDLNYDAADSLKMLRFRLRKYIQKLRQGKLKEKEHDDRAIENLRKLDDVRKQWPKLLPLHLKEKIVKDFRAATSSAALAVFTCASCGREGPIESRLRRSHSDVNLDVLDSPTCHWNDPDYPAPPTPFQTGPLRQKLLDVRGVLVDGDDITLDLCLICMNSLRRRSVPKHALANKLYVGPVPKELKELTMVEESMIARARSKSWIVKLQERDSDTPSPTSQRGFKGHTIIYPQNPDRLANVLPPTVQDTLTYICVIFVGSSVVTKQWLKDKAKPLVVRQQRV